VSHPFYSMLSPENQEMLERAAREEAAEERRRQAEADDRAMRAITLAPLIRQQQEQAMMRAEAEALRADAAQRKRAEERAVQLDDLRWKLQLEGKTWRTVDEVLRSAAGVIPP
jgi:hypothetical protein